MVAESPYWAANIHANSPSVSMLTRFEEHTEPSADVRVAVEMWPTYWEATFGWEASLCTPWSPECIDNCAQGQGSRAHDTGLTPGRGGPLRASQMMSRFETSTSRVAAVRGNGDITRRSASPVNGDHDASAGMP
jgi:hypothetical protein